MKSNCQLLIVGAGAAGIGAGQAARIAGIDTMIVEASHRTGGRGLTEELAPGIPWDLGCHWLHSASINPLAPVARELGLNYDTDVPGREFYLHGTRLTTEQKSDYERYTKKQWQIIEQAEADGNDTAASDLIDCDSPWASYFCYYQSLNTSEDVDCFSVLDLARYEDTGEDWPVREGYGTLLTQHAAGLAVELNTKVERIDWSAASIAVTTNRGVIRADQVVVTVSTGVLGARDITFVPALPLATQEAITALPLGCYNHCAMLYKEDYNFDPDTPERIDYSNGDDINFAFNLRCSGWPYIYTAVAGRQARWLERQPPAEMEQLMMSALIDTFGSDIRNKIIKFKSSAWSGDPFIKGAYSASQPGQADQRKVLATPIADRLFIAGEATSERAFCTAHGAWQSGRDAVHKIIAS